MSSTRPEGAPALAGLRVVEFGAGLGAYCGTLFAGLGAEVVLVEPPGGSPLRRRGPWIGARRDGEASLLHAALNAGKRSIRLDLGHGAELATARRLALRADLVVAGGPLPPALSHAALAAERPDLVTLALSPFGAEGPRAGWAAEDITGLALGGMLSLAGYPDGPPIAACGEMAVAAASLFGATAALAALLRAEAGGGGALVDVSMQECVAMGLENAIQFLDLEGIVRRRDAGGQRQAGTGVFPCRDGHVYLMAGGVASNRFWDATVTWLEAEGLPGAGTLREPRWLDSHWLATAEAKRFFAALFEPFAAGRSKAELVAAAAARRIPLAPIATARDILASEQLAARGFFVERALDDGRAAPFAGPPYQLSATPWRAPSPAPRLDADREAVLRDLEEGVPRPPAAATTPAAAPLAGVRVADFTWIGAGAYTTRLLADLGADVIKIESGTRIDTLRDARPFKDGVAGLNRSGYFSDRNCGKRSVTLDLKHPEGLRLARRIVAGSDVVANNFAPGVMDRLGLGYDAVRGLRPEAVYLAMSMKGATGPESDSRGYGLTIGALTGVQHLTALPGRLPAGTGTNFPDHIPNPSHAAFATLAAIRHRRRTGLGQAIDIAQTEPTIALLAPVLLDCAVNGTDPAPRGNAHPDMVMQGVFPCAGEDRWIAVSLRDAAEAAGAAAVLGLDAAPGAASEAAVAAATRGWDAAALAEALQARGIPAAPVLDSRDVLADPQLAARGHWARLDHPEVGPAVYNAAPFTMPGLGRHPSRPAPLIGQHTRGVLEDLLGLPPEEVDALEGTGALR